MSHQDKNLPCRDCGWPFAFSAEDQRLGRELGYDEPKRCRICRQLREDERALES